MPKAIWKGFISFGLINVPVAVLPAEQRDELTFHLVDDRDLARVRYQRINERTGREVEPEHVVKAHAAKDGALVLVTEEDFRSAAPEADQAIALQAFVKAADIPPAYFERPYYLEPDTHGDKGYALLREALRRSGMAGLGLVVLHGRQHLCLVLPAGPALQLLLLRFAAELRPTEGLRLPGDDLTALKISPRELEMAETLIAAMAAPWKPQDYRDAYRDKLLAFIAAKASAGEAAPPPASPAPPASGKVVDLLELLQKSLAAAGATGAAPRPAEGQRVAPKPAPGKAAKTKPPKAARG